jgi:hypothetical protein
MRTNPEAFTPRAAAESYEVGIEWPNPPVGTILTSNWSVEPDDGSLSLSGQAIAGSVTTIRMTGGTPGRSYAVRNVITVSGPNGVDTFAASVRQDVAW